MGSPGEHRNGLRPCNTGADERDLRKCEQGGCCPIVPECESLLSRAWSAGGRTRVRYSQGLLVPDSSSNWQTPAPRRCWPYLHLGRVHVRANGVGGIHLVVPFTWATLRPFDVGEDLRLRWPVCMNFLYKLLTPSPDLLRPWLITPL